MITDKLISEKLFQIYSLFSKGEIRELQRWLASPFFKSDSRLVKLHQYFATASEEEWCSKEQAYRHVFGKGKYNDKSFRYLISELMSAAEECIYYTEVKKVRPYFIHYLDEYYSQRQSEVCKLNLKNRITADRLKQHRKMKTEDLLHAHFADELKAELHSASLKEYARQVVAVRSAQPSGLDDYYLIEKLRQLCITANDNNVFGAKAEVFRQRETLAWAAARASGNLLVKTYTHVYALLLQKSAEEFEALKELLRPLSQQYDSQLVSELFTYARNFCISQINAGQQHYFHQLFELYKQGMDSRILLVNGELNERNYKNMVTTALRIGQLKWAEEFINESRFLLNPRVRENAFYYNSANLFFHQHRFDKALQSLQRVQLSDLFYSLDARSLTVKCFFELDEREAFLNAYLSFKQYVQRKKVVSDTHRKNYLQFLSLARQLMNVRPRDKQRLETIGKKIESAKNIADKNWLQEKWRQLQ